MQYYHDIITQKSFAYLQQLKREYDFILIGGWAVFLYTHALKSKDIDIIIDYPALAKMKEKYEVIKNDRLKKYEIKTGEFDIDIYLGHYSELGIDITEIETNTSRVKGFSVPRAEILLLLKLYAWKNRRGSAKGQKDELDIFSMAIRPEFDWKLYTGLVEKYGFQGFEDSFKAVLKKTRSLKELGINEQAMAKIKKRIFR